MASYPITCPHPHCGRVLDSRDSMSDSRAMLDDHLLWNHPDQPDPTFDPRFEWADDTGSAS